VVGAAPVGLTMALELARYGTSVRIVDRAAARSGTSKALAVWQRTLVLLDRAGFAEACHLLGFPGVQDALAERPSETAIRYPSSRFIGGEATHRAGPGPGGRIIAALPFGVGDRARSALMARRDEATQALLQDHAALPDPEPRDPPDSAGAWLVRPDGHVAAGDQAGDLRAIRTVLGRIAV
jgi:2-polyprenyl-6-methoxyphenol hydroxylase-like FAD-dependent oxidoreductase